jgi:hypothetical protein
LRDCADGCCDWRRYVIGGVEAGDGDGDGDPRRRLMGIWTAVFHLPPSNFWQATPHEVWAALEVHKEMNKRQ